MDKVEKYICDWFFEKNDKINLVERLKQIPKEKDANKKFKKLNDEAQEILQTQGANKQMPEGLRIINTILFGVCIILILLHIRFNSTQGAFFIGEEFKYIGTGIVFFMSFIPISLYLLYIPLRILSIVRHKVNKLTKKISGKRIVSTAVTIFLLTVVIIGITNYIVPGTFFIADEILFAVALLIILTDNLMLKNSPIMIEDFSKINILASRIENTLIEERKIEEIILWEKYLSYAVAFGSAKQIIKKIKDIPLDDDLLKLFENEEFSDLINNDYYSFYAHASLDRVFLRGYLNTAGNILKHSGSSGSSRGSGGGFSGGGRFSGGGGAF